MKQSQGLTPALMSVSLSTHWWSAAAVSHARRRAVGARERTSGDGSGMRRRRACS